MYLLRKSDGTIQYLNLSKQYNVGRKNCDILISGDPSISRIHAIISVQNDKVTLKDCGSRYCTFVNDIKIELNSNVELHNGNIIRFGVKDSIFKFEKIQIIVTYSGTISTAEKEQLTSHLKCLDGKIVQNWRADCTHVTVREIMLTVKVLCACVVGQSIVNLNFWSAYVESVKKGSPLPDPNDFKPVCSEVMLSKHISLDFNPLRKSLFKNKIFVFPTKSVKEKMQDLIAVAGGTCFSWDIKRATKEEMQKSSDEYLIIQNSESVGKQENMDSFNEVVKYLHGIGKRTIPLQEIALSVVSCSCEKECNPSFDRAGTLVAQNEASINLKKILALETQTQLLDAHVEPEKFKKVIPETMENDVSLTLPGPSKINVAEKILEVARDVEQNEVKITKRQGAELEDTLASSTKRCKIDENSNKNELVRNPFLSMMKTSEKESEKSRKSMFTLPNKNAKTNTNENIKSQSKKRKTDEVEGVVPKKMPSSLKTNPFMNLRKSSESSVSKIKSTNPFTNSARSVEFPEQNQSGGLSRALKFQVVNGPDISNATLVDSELEKKYPTWLLKSNLSSLGDVSSSVTIKMEFDDEMSHYIKSYSDTIIVKTISFAVTPRKAKSIEDSPQNGTQTNFKKFKKVQPLHVQTTIFPKALFTNYICNNEGVNVQQEKSDDEDALISNGFDEPKPNGKKKSKQFRF